MTTPQCFGPVMLDVAGWYLTIEEQEKLRHPNTGGVILFARNYHDPVQLTQLCTQIRSARQSPILIAVDQEGGRVQRFQQGFTRLPAANVYANQPSLAAQAGWLMASELLAVGVDFSFAPVLDVDRGVSSVIGNRAFAQTARSVAELASAFRSGMRQAGMAAVGKHFPGHGAVTLDSHLTLPVDTRSLADINTHDLLPFKRLITEGIEGIMPAHVVYAVLDPNPAGFSRYWIQDILRRELQFSGAVFSDDLNMAGAAWGGSFVERAERAKAAGCDMLLVCNNPDGAAQVLEQLPITLDAQRERRLQAMRGQTRQTLTQLQANAQWQATAHQLNQLTA